MMLLAVVLFGCGHTPDRLPELERRFYYNLATPEIQQQFLRLKPEQRKAFLVEQGLWQAWSSLSTEERDAASRGHVDVGFREFAVFMAWGPPADTQIKSTRGGQVEFHTFIRCTSGPKTGRFVRSNLECDGTASETRVGIKDGLVREIEYGA
jgi:hypothetical protein